MTNADISQPYPRGRQSPSGYYETRTSEAGSVAGGGGSSNLFGGDAPAGFFFVTATRNLDASVLYYSDGSSISEINDPSGNFGAGSGSGANITVYIASGSIIVKNNSSNTEDIGAEILGAM